MTSIYIFEHNEVDLDLTITSNNIQIFMMIYDIFIHFFTHLTFSLNKFSVDPLFFCSLLKFVSGLCSFVANLFHYEISKRHILVMTLQADTFVYKTQDSLGFIQEMLFVYSMYLNIFFPLIDVYFSLTRLCIIHQRDPKENSFTATKECI